MGNDTMSTMIIYDVDSVADVKDLISTDTSIADADIIAKITSFINPNDLLLVKKVMNGGIKIVDVTKVDPTLIGTYLK
jgi:hypothetical protein